MRLLIVSHTPHYRSNGTLVGWGPTIREIDHLARLFADVVHVAPVHDDVPPPSAMPYAASNVVVREVSPAGGERLSDKLAVVRRTPEYVSVLRKEMEYADVIHVRCPANIALIALIMLGAMRTPARRWAKYAGNWAPDRHEPLSYRFQRWWLRRGLHRGVVTVNGEWPDQPRHVHSFLNPCLTDEEREQARLVAVRKRLVEPLRLLFVGRLEEEKGVGRCIAALQAIVSDGINAGLDVVGDGPERAEFERRANELELGSRVRFHGWLPRSVLGELYACAHHVVLPSTSSEGWPKVLSEGMAYGAVPITSTVSSIPQLLERFRTGKVLPATDVGAIAGAIVGYLRAPDAWSRDSANAVEAANYFTYSAHIRAVRQLLELDAPIDKQ